MLSEVIQNMIGHQPDMVVVDEVVDPIELLRTAKATLADVVIVTPLESNGEPKICHYLLAEYPHLKVVTISARGEAAYLYQSDADRLCIDEPCEQSILNTIREALRKVTGS